MPSASVITALLAIISASSSLAWQDNIQPKRSIMLGTRNVVRFQGNQSHPDHFKLLETNGDSILVGARNIVYNLSLHDMAENRQQRIEWHPASTHREMCLVKGKSEDDCQNYVRVLARISDEEMLVCGTNAFNPLCRRYGQNGTSYEVMKEFSGKGLSPYDPNHNSTAVFSDGELYAGTVSDFSGLDPLIYRDPLRTEQYDFKHLNAPNFVGSLSFGDYVYFFFRETAVEYFNCGKAIYSRVGRVCKKDKGGPHRWSNRWTSFLKSRLNCSLPGEFPFYFNEIQSVSDVVEGTYGRRTERLVYGVFTTPENSIYGSAICAFRLQDVMDSFDGAFKSQASMNSNWLPVSVNDVPEPRPGQCVNDSRTLPEVTLNFIKTNPLMDESVPAFYGLPLLTHTSLRYKFTRLAVDPQVRTVDGKTYDILIIGTDKGKIVRAINTESYDSLSKVKPVVIEEIQVSGNEAPITNLRVVRSESPDAEPRLVVVTNDEISSVPLFRCHSDTITTCSECVALQDPYCAWNPAVSRCASVASVDSSAHSSLIQNVLVGYSDQCPDNGIAKKQRPSTTPPFTRPDSNEIDVEIESNVTNSEEILKTHYRDGKHLPDEDIEIIAQGSKVGATLLPLGIYSAEAFTIAVVVSCFGSLVVGFVSGLMFSRRCKMSDPFGGASDTFSGAPYLEQRRLSRLNETSTSCSEPSKMNNFVDSLSTAIKIANEKNMANCSNNAVDSKPTIQKVKKTYV